MLEYNQDQNKNFNSNQTPEPTVAPVTDTTVSVEQVAVSQPKRKWWLYALVALFLVLVGLGAWWYYAKYSPNTEVLEQVKKIVDIDSVVGEQGVDDFIFFDTRTIEVNSSKERINEFSFLYPKEMEFTKLTGASVYFKKNDSNLALVVMSYKIEGETDQDHLSSHAVVLENGEYKFEQNKNLLLYREDFTLSKSKIEIGGGEFDDYHARLLKNGHLASISYIDFDNTEAGALDVLDKVIDSLQNYGAVGYSGQDESNEVATSTTGENGERDLCFGEDCIFNDMLDTDGDLLLDLQETGIYHTDPNNPDTDGDTYTDFEEINNGYNPLGEGLLKISDFSLATPEDTLAAWAKVIHDIDVKLFLNIATSNNTKYPLTYDEGYDYLTWVRGFYGDKSIAFEIISTDNEAGNILDLKIRTLLDGEFFRQDSIELIQIDKEWKIYVPRYEN